jgi:hypothetical protein
MPRKLTSLKRVSTADLLHRRQVNIDSAEIRNPASRSSIVVSAIENVLRDRGVTPPGINRCPTSSNLRTRRVRDKE